MRAALIVCVALTAIFPTRAAHADRGAVSIEAGGAVTVVRVAAPYSTGNVVGSVSSFDLGARYAVANSLELSTRIFYEPSAPFYVHGVTTTLGTSGALSAGLITHVRTYGALLGARVLHGNVWRFIASAEAGIVQTSFSGQDLVDESNPKTFRGRRSRSPQAWASSGSAIASASRSCPAWSCCSARARAGPSQRLSRCRGTSTSDVRPPW